MIIMAVNLKLMMIMGSFTKPLESTLHCKFAKCMSMHECLAGCQASSSECQCQLLGNNKCNLLWVLQKISISSAVSL